MKTIEDHIINQHVYYENTLIPVNDEFSKINRIVVFSVSKITVPYAVKVDIEDDIIEISERFMPVKDTHSMVSIYTAL